MTRKDYIKLAEIIKDSSTLMNVGNQPRYFLDRGEFMQGLCRMLENDNPNFNELMFRGAAGEMFGE